MGVCKCWVLDMCTCMHECGRLLIALVLETEERGCGVS